MNRNGVAAWTDWDVALSIHEMPVGAMESVPQKLVCEKHCVEVDSTIDPFEGGYLFEGQFPHFAIDRHVDVYVRRAQALPAIAKVDLDRLKVLNHERLLLAIKQTAHFLAFCSLRYFMGCTQWRAGQRARVVGID